MVNYNIIEGQNTILRGLIAEEFARYILIQRYPLLILRPKTVLQYLQKRLIKGQKVQFMRKYYQTMDYFGIGPINVEDIKRLNAEGIIGIFFYASDGLPQYLTDDEWVKKLEGYIIEVKSRTKINSWTPFQYSFSLKQKNMFYQSEKLGFATILCGVTFENDWDLSLILTDGQGKILPRDFLSKG